MDERILDTTQHLEDEETMLRPSHFDEYIGQNEMKENMKIFVGAAKMRNEALDHVLLYGPPGLGKTTMAMVLANELGCNIHTTTGPAIDKKGDLVGLLTQLEPGDILFIDEIHRLNKTFEEILYSAMEDYYVDVVIGGEGSTRSVRFDVPPFTLVGATTRAGDLSAPLRDRFGIMSKLEYYNISDLTSIVSRTASVFEMEMDEDAKVELAKRSRGTPRIANRLFRRVRDFAQYHGDEVITLSRTQEALERLKVDNLGLDDVDHKYLLGIIERYNGGPVGLEAIAASIGEEPVTLEDVYEPYLLQTGLIKRTHRGRIVTQKAYDHLGIPFISE